MRDGMVDREKVVKALECCTKKICIYKGTEKECPYWELSGEYEDSFEDCTTALSKDALVLLKAQKPRVMTLEEAQGADYCWYESRTANICILCDATMYPNLNGKPKTELQTMGTALRGWQYDYAYGKDWRCWDKEPTNAQREKVKWDAQEQRDYEAAVEMAEYCERYEPTYNADDGSM